MSAGSDRSAVESAKYRALSLVETLAATAPPTNGCAGKGCDADPVSAVRTAHKPPTAYCAECAERELGRYQTAREYPLSAVTPPEMGTTLEKVQESKTCAAFELSPPADDPEFCEMYVRAENVTTQSHRLETVLDLETTV